jgi:hypothetical protein
LRKAGESGRTFSFFFFFDLSEKYLQKKKIQVKLTLTKFCHCLHSRECQLRPCRVLLTRELHEKGTYSENNLFVVAGDITHH